MKFRLCQIGERPASPARIKMRQLSEDVQQLRQMMMPPRKGDVPGWARGLRQIYQAVAEEPVPADFSVLLNRLEGWRF